MKKKRITDAMRIAALAAEVGKLSRARVNFGLRVWQEGFTVAIYGRRGACKGICIASSNEPHDDIEVALREALDNLYGDTAEATP